MNSRKSPQRDGPDSDPFPRASITWMLAKIRSWNGGSISRLVELFDAPAKDIQWWLAGSRAPSPWKRERIATVFRDLSGGKAREWVVDLRDWGLSDAKISKLTNSAAGQPGRWARELSHINVAHFRALERLHQRTHASLYAKWARGKKWLLVGHKTEVIGADDEEQALTSFAGTQDRIEQAPPRGVGISFTLDARLANLPDKVRGYTIKDASEPTRPSFAIVLNQKDPVSVQFDWLMREFASHVKDHFTEFFPSIARPPQLISTGPKPTTANLHLSASS